MRTRLEAPAPLFVLGIGGAIIAEMSPPATATAYAIPRRNLLGAKRFDARIAWVDPAETLSERLGRLAFEFQQGRLEAFDAIVLETRDRIYAMLLRAVRDPGAAEDLAQETFVKAYRSLPALRDPASCERWLYQIAINLVRDHGRRRSLEQRAIAEMGREAAHEEAPAEPVEQDTRLRRSILAAVGELPEHHREVFVMREIQGMSHEAIAKSLRIPEGTVWSRLSFARRALQGKLRRRMGS